MIPRDRYADRIALLLQEMPVVALLGPRQCGKTTMARFIQRNSSGSAFFDLESPAGRSRLENPMLALDGREGLVVIDEIQRLPGMFEVLRVLADRPDRRCTFLVLGSAAPGLVRGASETLAGRIGFVDLSGFDLGEVGEASALDLWNRGGFPRSFLAASDSASMRWRDDFIRTFLERDIPQLGITIPSETLRRFWTMIAHYHGQTWNAAEFARSLGTAEATSRKYLDILSGAYVVRQLQPWFANIKKRQVHAPKVYIRDSGILHALLGLSDLDELRGHPKNGASWEGFVIEQVVSMASTRESYYWATHSGAELDLLLFRGGRPIGVEIKYTDSPRTTRSMRVAMSDLDLDHLYVVHPGQETYPLEDAITALCVADISQIVGPRDKTKKNESTSTVPDA